MLGFALWALPIALKFTEERGSPLCLPVSGPTYSAWAVPTRAHTAGARLWCGLRFSPSRSSCPRGGGGWRCSEAPVRLISVPFVFPWGCAGGTWAGVQVAKGCLGRTAAVNLWSERSSANQGLGPRMELFCHSGAELDGSNVPMLGSVLIPHPQQVPPISSRRRGSMQQVLMGRSFGMHEDKYLQPEREEQSCSREGAAEAGMDVPSCS